MHDQITVIFDDRICAKNERKESNFTWTATSFFFKTIYSEQNKLAFKPKADTAMDI